MFDLVDPVTGAVGTAAGLTLVMWIIKVILKQFSSGVLDVRSDHATGRLIADLVSQNERLQASKNAAEEKANALNGRRMTDRGHAIYAKSIIEIYNPLPEIQRNKVLSEIEEIIDDAR